MSAGQSFITRSSVVVSHPFTAASRAARSVGWKSSAALSFLAPLSSSSSKKHRSHLSAGTLTAAEDETTDVLPARITEILADNPEFIKPDRDLQEYRYIKLPNNLQVLLVSTGNSGATSDGGAKVEAASAHIQAGHFDDTIPGLAHFHEHMLVRTEYNNM
jgi:hypothetical protein